MHKSSTVAFDQPVNKEANVKEVLHGARLREEVVDVAVLSANFNNAHYLSAFIESIAASTVYPKQIIIVDDCSTDDSLAILKDCVAKVANLDVICLERNVGFANALNCGLLHVNTRYVARIDPDDMIATSRLELQYRFLEQNQSFSVVGSNVLYVNHDATKIVGKSNFPPDHHAIMQRYQRGEHGLVHGACLFRSEIFQLVRYRQEYVPAEEYDLFSRIMLCGYLAGNLTENLTRVRIHDKSVSQYLPYDTVKKTFQLRDVFFATKTSGAYVLKEYIARYSYRRALCSAGIKKLLFMVIASVLKPGAVIGRIKQFRVVK